MQQAIGLFHGDACAFVLRAAHRAHLVCGPRVFALFIWCRAFFGFVRKQFAGCQRRARRRRQLRAQLLNQKLFIHPTTIAKRRGDGKFFVHDGRRIEVRERCVTLHVLCIYQGDTDYVSR